MNSLNIVHFNPGGIRGRQTNILNYIDQGPVAMPIRNLIQLKLHLALSMYLVN